MTLRRRLDALEKAAAPDEETLLLVDWGGPICVQWSDGSADCHDRQYTPEAWAAMLAEPGPRPALTVLGCTRAYWEGADVQTVQLSWGDTPEQQVLEAVNLADWEARQVADTPSGDDPIDDSLLADWRSLTTGRGQGADPPGDAPPKVDQVDPPEPDDPPDESGQTPPLPDPPPAEEDQEAAPIPDRGFLGPYRNPGRRTSAIRTVTLSGSDQKVQNEQRSKWALPD